MGRTRTTTMGLGALLLLLSAAGCYKHTVHSGQGAPAGPVVYDHWEHFWIGGLIGDTRLDLRQLCASEDATVRIRQTFLNGLVTGLTGGIYTPTTVEVRCRTGRSGNLRLDATDMRNLAEHDDLVGWVRAYAPEWLDEVERARADR
ncbi:MAG: Bor family protein [Longimicrobiales bacterium]